MPEGGGRGRKADGSGGLNKEAFSVVSGVSGETVRMMWL